MKFENTAVWGFEHALRGMRNPKESWGKSDTMNCNDYEGNCEDCHNYKAVCHDNRCDWFPYIIGNNDMKLA